jgi:hypothetical protein
MRTAVRGVDVYEINGPLGFDALATFKRAIDSIAKRPRLAIERCPIMGDVGEENVTESFAAAVALAPVALARGASR